MPSRDPQAIDTAELPDIDSTLPECFDIGPTVSPVKNCEI